MAWLNVVSSVDDRELGDIRQTLGAFEGAAGLDDVVTIMKRCSARGRCAEVLDVTGHSRSDGFLIVGSWVIDDSAQTAASFILLLRPSLQQIGIRTIRLLGCATATTHRGRQAMRRIAQVTGCSVLGTKRGIGKHDYGRSGFTAKDALVAVDCSRL